MSVGNLGRIVAIAVISFVALIAELFIQAGADVADTTNRIHLRRRCRQCRAIFMPGSPLSRQPVCGQCGYNLTGNTSGVCPECGWKLSRRVRASVQRFTTKTRRHEE